MENHSDDIAALLKESATAFIAEKYGSRPPRFEIEEPRPVDRALWGEMADLGWLGLALPESLGGLGMGMGEAATLAEALGRKAVPEPFVAAALMPSLLLSHADSTSALVQGLAAGIASGEGLHSVAWQEEAGSLEGTDPGTRLSDGTLTGRKCFVPVVEDDSVLLVSAKSGPTLVVVAVAATAPGVRIQRQAGGLMSLATVSFEGAPIMDGAIVLEGATAAAALQATLEGGRIGAAAQLTGIAAGALDNAVAYVNERVQFDRPIGSFQSIQHRCVDYRIAAMLAAAAWHHAQRAYDADPLAPATQAAISAAKARAGDAAMQTCKGSVQMHGAMGFTEEGGVGIYLRAAMQLSTWLGNGTAHRRRFLATAA